jgi:hypothetical protein
MKAELRASFQPDTAFYFRAILLNAGSIAFRVPSWPGNAPGVLMPLRRLFGIERRAAQRLLRRVDVHVSSRSAVVTGEWLIYSDRLLAGKPLPA